MPKKKLKPLPFRKKHHKEQTDIPDRLLIDVQEAARILGVSPTTVRDACRSRELLAWKPRDKWLLDKMYVRGYFDGSRNRNPS